MLSVKGVYENGVIQLLDPIQIEEKTEVIITFLDENLPGLEEIEETDSEESWNLDRI